MSLSILKPSSILFALLVIALAGCTPRIAVNPQSEAPELALWEAHKKTMASIKTWHLKAKIGIKTGSKGGSATLKWQYGIDNQEIELYGPFGGGRVIIEVEPNQAVLRDTKGKLIEGETAEEVLYERLGWTVPFRELAMWVRGLPTEEAKDLTFDSNGFLTHLVDGIWEVDYQEYQTVDATTLPRKLTLTTLPGKVEIYDDDGKYLGDELSVKVILKRWWDFSF